MVELFYKNFGAVSEAGISHSYCCAQYIKEWNYYVNFRKRKEKLRDNF